MRLLFECLLLMSPVMWTQPVGLHPVFEVASIKMAEAKGGGGHSHENDTPGLFRGSNIMTAYDVRDFQVTARHGSAGAGCTPRNELSGCRCTRLRMSKECLSYSGS